MYWLIKVNQEDHVSIICRTGVKHHASITSIYHSVGVSPAYSASLGPFEWSQTLEDE